MNATANTGAMNRDTEGRRDKRERLSDARQTRVAYRQAIRCAQLSGRLA